MSDLIGIDAELTRLTKALREAVVGFEAAIKEAADRRSVYDVEWAKAMLKADGSSRELREAEATLVVKEYMRDARIAEATRDAFKERVRAIEAVITIQQSRLRFISETEPSGF